MSIGKKLCVGTLIIFLLLTGLCGLIGFLAGPLVPDIITAIISGPNIVQSVPSPDGNFEAYVEEQPSRFS